MAIGIASASSSTRSAFAPARAAARPLALPLADPVDRRSAPARRVRRGASLEAEPVSALGAPFGTPFDAPPGTPSAAVLSPPDRTGGSHETSDGV